jgi:hypothetical protein
MTEAAQIRAAEILKRCPALPLLGVEVGVYKGDLSYELLKRRGDLTLWMVDSWAAREKQPDAYRSTGDPHANLSQQAQDGYRAIAKAETNFAADRRRILAMDSLKAAAEAPDATFDFVFIDADHSYEGCKADIAAWAPKVKPFGLLAGHDYRNPHPPVAGVTRAVDEAARDMGRVLDLGGNYTWFINV